MASLSLGARFDRINDNAKLNSVVKPSNRSRRRSRVRALVVAIALVRVQSQHSYNEHVIPMKLYGRAVYITITIIIIAVLAVQQWGVRGK